MASALSRNVKCFIELEHEIKMRMDDHEKFMEEFKKFLLEHSKTLRKH